ncbi:hypothetical protein P43SY_004373 [Pythium insidiosum]|uniref:DEAD-box RNA helicase Q domain-containing protein n=1 Tax=Pythium insidiosum TaxID=114742 RepID=A0AAD5QAN6_PYTIN|nr:hypothetical protein P43SY_004373 [Pythium insidiosum]
MASAFEEMGVCAELSRVIAEQDWLVPTPVQTEVVPLLLGGRDVLAAAETVSCRGSRKREDRDKDARLNILDGGLVVSSTDPKRWFGARATFGVRQRGKYLVEMEIKRCGGIARVGWSTIAASLDLGTDRHGYGYGGTGKKAHGRHFQDYDCEFIFPPPPSSAFKAISCITATEFRVDNNGRSETNYVMTLSWLI